MMGLSASESYAQTNPIIVVPNSVDDIMRGATGPICSAYVDPLTGYSVPLTGLTSRMVNCILGTVSWATQKYLGTFGNAFIDTVNVLAVMATILLGFFILTGRTQAVGRETVMLIIKVGVVIWMVNLGAFATLFPAVLYTIEWLVGLVTNYTNIPLTGILSSSCPYSPFIWNRVDCVINTLVGGLTANVPLNFGIIGLISAMLFSSGVGVGIFFFLIGILLAILKSVFQAMFILLSAYIAIALLVVIAPLMIPLILFRATKQYFEKWLRLLIGVMLQPIFLFAYLTMFLIALEVAVFSGDFSVYRSIACDYATVPGFTIGDYINRSGAIAERSGTSSFLSANFSQRPKNFEGTSDGAQTNFAGSLGTIAEKNVTDPDAPFATCDANTPGGLANCSSNNVSIKVMAAQISQLAANCNNMNPVTYFVRLILSLFTAMALIYVFSTMLQFIPYLGTLISSGDLFGLPSLMKELPGDLISKSKLQDKFTSIKGGQQ